VIYVGEYGIANILWQWQSGFAPTFALYKNAAVIPVDVSKTKCRYITSA
jgi:hypothetical protein